MAKAIILFRSTFAILQIMIFFFSLSIFYIPRPDVNFPEGYLPPKGWPMAYYQNYQPAGASNTTALIVDWAIVLAINVIGFLLLRFILQKIFLKSSKKPV